LGKVWAKFELKRQGIETDAEIEVKVSLRALEEETRQRQYEGLRMAAETVPDLPQLTAFKKVVIETIPGLTEDQRRELLDELEAMVEAQAAAVEPAPEEGVEGVGPMVPGGVGPDAMGYPPDGTPMPPPAPGMGDYGQVPTTAGPVGPPQDGLGGAQPY
jgi:hypothetical protein